MLLMGMQKKNSDMDSLMEHLEFKGINVLNVFEEGRVNNLLWQMNTRKNNELFIMTLKGYIIWSLLRNYQNRGRLNYM